MTSNGKVSFPAATGVWTVNAVPAATTSRASANGDARLDEFAAALEGHEGAVPLVHVPRGRGYLEGAQQPHPADAQDDLLGDAGALVAAVKAREQPPVLRSVLRHVGVQEVD
jgi:hypothetical protein